MAERSCCTVKRVVQHVLENPKYYPGPHNLSAPRTTQGLQQLDTTRQMMLIWDALCQYMQESLEGGRSVNIPYFGAFTFENSLHEDGSHPSNPRKAAKHSRPCFLVDERLKKNLYRYPGKEEIRVGRNDHSVYQSAPRMEFLNVVPIAAGCYYTTKIVTSAITQFFKAVVDLAQRGYNVDLDFGFARVRIFSRALQVAFARRLGDTVNKSHVRTFTPEATSATWKSANLSQSMVGLIERPQSAEVRARRNRTKHLGVMSCDMCSITLQGRALGATA
eukprot:CAMPEP_0204291076 /NCGR_PEP_ID=MMETSP0468-20130131/61797_1 /ASSEMBLY_ACC=CAM_ASM_000383 /TAXON_ID=2969 /ORGANISM="Oxyrrhis marina" /LENGTH=275 /DNA_ID=CAMNT_0051269351 /DNA_START=55 /DNA_END=882 /DNA_ORIENTATION=+